MEKLLSPQEVAAIIGVRVGTVYSWISRGVPIPHVKISGTIRFQEKSLRGWIEEKERERKKRNFEL